MLSPEEFVTEKAHRFGDSELARMEKAHRRGIAWLRKNLGKKPPLHIKRAFDEMRALEELVAAQRDSEAMQEYQRQAREHNGEGVIPPVPKAGRVAIQLNQSVRLMAALDAKRRRDG